MSGDKATQRRVDRNAAALLEIGCGGLEFMDSIYVTPTGCARPCNGIRPDEAGLTLNARDASLAEIINTPFSRQARYVDQNVQGKCRRCEHVFDCVGCRGMAFASGVAQGKDAFGALVCDDPTCFKN